MMFGAWGPEHDVVMFISPPLLCCLCFMLCQLNPAILLGLLALYEILAKQTEPVSFYHLDYWRKSPAAFGLAHVEPTTVHLGTSCGIFPLYFPMIAHVVINDSLYSAEIFFWCICNTLSTYHRVARTIDVATTMRPWYVQALFSHSRQLSIMRFITLCTTFSLDMSHPTGIPRIVVDCPLASTRMPFGRCFWRYDVTGTATHFPGCRSAPEPW